jgi:hypothetical protein
VGVAHLRCVVGVVDRWHRHRIPRPIWRQRFVPVGQQRRRRLRWDERRQVWEEGGHPRREEHGVPSWVALALLAQVVRLEAPSVRERERDLGPAHMRREDLLVRAWRSGAEAE